MCDFRAKIVVFAQYVSLNCCILIFDHRLKITFVLALKITKTRKRTPILSKNAFKKLKNAHFRVKIAHFLVRQTTLSTCPVLGNKSTGVTSPI